MRIFASRLPWQGLESDLRLVSVRVSGLPSQDTRAVFLTITHNMGSDPAELLSSITGSMERTRPYPAPDL